MNVHILATCRKPELLPWTEFVFKSIRVGFPSARIIVSNNALPNYAEESIAKLCAVNDCLLESTIQTIHHFFIEDLLNREDAPFFLLDCDVHFFKSFEQFIPQFKGAALAGWRIPQWKDDFSKCITRARLHPSLLYVDPVGVRAMVKGYEARITDTVFTPKANLIYPLVVPYGERPYFYDTTSLLYHAIGGMPFTQEMLDAYCHMFFGSIPDVVLPHLPESEAAMMQKARMAILNNPALGYRAHLAQMEYYENRQF